MSADNFGRGETIELLREFCEKIKIIKLTGLLKLVPDILITITGSIAVAVVEEQARQLSAQSLPGR